MASTAVAQRNSGRLEYLSRAADIAKNSLHDADNQLFRLRREEKTVPATNPDMQAAVAAIRHAGAVLADNQSSWAGLPDASAAVKLLDKGVAGIESALRMTRGKTINPGRLQDALPAYELQEASGAARRDIIGIDEGIRTLSTGTSGISTVARSIPASRINRVAGGLDQLAVAADASRSTLDVAEELASRQLDRVRAQNPKAQDHVISTHLLDSWGIRPLARQAARSIEAAADSKAIPLQSDAKHAAGEVRGSLEPLQPGMLTDPVRDRTVSLSAVVNSLSGAAHDAALTRNEAKQEAAAVRLVGVYGAGRR